MNTSYNFIQNSNILMPCKYLILHLKNLCVFKQHKKFVCKIFCIEVNLFYYVKTATKDNTRIHNEVYDKRNSRNMLYAFLFLLKLVISRL